MHLHHPCLLEWLLEHGDDDSATNLRDGKCCCDPRAKAVSQTIPQATDDENASQGTLGEPGREPTPRTLSLLETDDDVWKSKSRLWPDGTPVNKVFSMLYIHKHMSLDSVNTEYRRLSKLRHPDKVPPEAKLAATEDFKYLQECYCKLKDFLKTGTPLEEDHSPEATYTTAQEKDMWRRAENRSNPLASPPAGEYR